MFCKSLSLLLIGTLLLSCSSNSSNELSYGDVEKKQTNDGIFQGDADDYFNNAEKYYGAKDYARALDQFEKHLKLKPESRAGQLGAAYSHYYMGIQSGERGRLQEAANQMKLAETGFKNLWNGKLVKDTTIEDDFNWKSCLGLAVTERAIAALEKKRIDLLDRRLTQIKDSTESKEALKRQSQYAEKRMHYLRSSFAKLQYLAQMQNTAPEVLINLGDLHLIRGNEAAAERAYLDYLTIAKNSVKFWNAQRQSAQDKYKTKTELNAALTTIKQKEESATRKTVNVLVHLAEIKFSRQNWGDSLSYLKEAMNLDPERQSLHVPMAECYDRLGNYDQALVHINQYIQTSPSFSKDTQRAFRLRSELIRKQGKKNGSESK